MPNPKKETYEFTLTCTLEIAPAVLDSAMEEEWQSTFYRMSRDEVAAMIGYNLIRNIELSRLDGFADRKNEEASIVRRSVDTEAVKL